MHTSQHTHFWWYANYHFWSIQVSQANPSAAKVDLNILILLLRYINAYKDMCVSVPDRVVWSRITDPYICAFVEPYASRTKTDSWIDNFYRPRMHIKGGWCVWLWWQWSLSIRTKKLRKVKGISICISWNIHHRTHKWFESHEIKADVRREFNLLGPFGSVGHGKNIISVNRKCSSEYSIDHYDRHFVRYFFTSGISIRMTRIQLIAAG